MSWLLTPPVLSLRFFHFCLQIHIPTAAGVLLKCPTRLVCPSVTALLLWSRLLLWPPKCLLRWNEGLLTPTPWAVLHVWPVQWIQTLCVLSSFSQPSLSCVLSTHRFRLLCSKEVVGSSPNWSWRSESQAEGWWGSRRDMSGNTHLCIQHFLWKVFHKMWHLLTFCTISHSSVQTYMHLLKIYIFKIAVDETIYSCQITKLDE